MMHQHSNRSCFSRPMFFFCRGFLTFGSPHQEVSMGADWSCGRHWGRSMSRHLGWHLRTTMDWLACRVGGVILPTGRRGSCWLPHLGLQWYAILPDDMFHIASLIMTSLSILHRIMIYLFLFFGSEGKLAGLVGVQQFFRIIDFDVNIPVFLEWDGECFSIVQLVGQWLFLPFCWSTILLDASYVSLVGMIVLERVF